MAVSTFLMLAIFLHAAEATTNSDYLQTLMKIEDLVNKLEEVGVRLPNIKSFADELAGSKAAPTPQNIAQAKKLQAQLENIWRVRTSTDTSVMAGKALDEIYGLRWKVFGVQALLLDAAEQLFDQSFVTSEIARSNEMLRNSMALIEAVKNMIAGKAVDIRVSKGSYSESGEAEVSIASVETSGGAVRMYVTEETQRYANQTVVITKNSFINLGNMIIIQKEVNRNLGPRDEAREILVGQNIAIGAVLNIRKAFNQPTIEKAEYDVAVRDYSFDRNYIRLVLSSREAKTGRIIIIDVDKTMLRDFLSRDVSVRVDGVPVRLAHSIVEVLKGEADKPLYFLAITGRGLQIVLYIPTWSTKIVLIGSSSSLSYLISIPKVVGSDVEVLATTVAAAVLITALLVTRLPRLR